MLLNTAFDNRKPQAVAGPIAGIRGPEERLENTGLLGGRYPDALVADLNQAALGVGTQADQDRPIRVLQRIGQQVVQRLPQPERVAANDLFNICCAAGGSTSQ